MSNTANSEPKKRIYLDHAASTPVGAAARAAMARAAGLRGNPSSIHAEGREAQALLAESRARAAAVVGAAPGEIVFTGSGSEADALALHGAAYARRALGRHLVVSSIEHKAVLKAAEALAREGFEVSYAVPGQDGTVLPQTIGKLLRNDTTLVSVMYANNEVGTVEPVKEIAALVHARSRALVHTDACQAPGQLSVNADELGVDLMSLNSSKVYGPKGAGALYVRRGVMLEPLVGGEQERGLRGGTESVELTLGFAAALEEAETLRAQEAPRLSALRDLLIAEIEKRIPDAQLNGHRTRRLPNNVHVSIPAIEGEAMLLMLDAAGVACATGSACNSFDLAPSHVLLALGAEAALAHGSVRLTLGRETTQAEVRFAARELARVVGVLKSISALTAPALV